MKRRKGRLIDGPFSTKTQSGKFCLALKSGIWLAHPVNFRDRAAIVTAEMNAWLLEGVRFQLQPESGHESATSISLTTIGNSN